MKKDTNLALLSMLALAVAQPLYDIFSQYPEFFVVRGTTPLELFSLIGVISLVVPGLLVGVNTLLFSIHRYAGNVFSLGLLLLLLVVFWLPIVDEYLSFNIEVIALFTLILSSVLLVLFLVSETIRLFLIYLSISAIVVPAMFMIDNQIQKILFPESIEVVSTPGYEATADLPQVVMLVFDELPYWALVNSEGDIDKHRFPNFAQLASGAHWFSNTYTASEVTVHAVPAILSGRYPIIGTLPFYQDHPENLFSWLGKIYPVHAIESASRLCPAHVCSRDENILDERRQNSFYRDVYYVSLHILSPEALRHHLPTISQGWGNFVQTQKTFDTGTDSAAWRKMVGDSMAKDRSELFKEFTDHLDYTDGPSLHFIHMMLPHVPYEYYPSGKRYTSNALPMLKYEKWFDDEWAVVNAHQRFLLQLGYVDRLLGGLMTKLKASDRYSDALIIVTGDHGVSFQAGEYRRSVSENTAEDVLHVPLIIKLPGQKKPEVWDQITELVDIIPTIAATLKIQPPPGVEGQSLFALDRFPSRERYLSYKTRKYENYKRKSNEEQSGTVQIFGDGEDSSQFAPGKYKQLLNQSVTTLPIKLGTHSLVIDQLHLFEDVNTAGTALPLRLTGVIQTEPKIENYLDLAISLNGNIVSMGQTFHTKPDQFSLMIPETSLKDGKNLLEIFKIIPHKEGAVLERSIQNKFNTEIISQYQPLLSSEFNNSREVVFKMNAQNMSGFKMINDLTYRQSKGTLVLNSEGTDPHFLLPEFAFRENRLHIVKLTIDSLQDVQIKAFYLPKGQDHFSSGNSVSTDLTVDKNIIYLKIWEPNLVGRLRLDPGNVIGEYSIRDIEIRALVEDK